MKEELKHRFKALGSFPSPPRIAQEIISLAKNPDTASIAKVSECLSKDPGLATKVLRMANSAIYARRRCSQNLRQALTVVGLEATITLCLGFTIVGSYRNHKAGSIDYSRYWRRCVLEGLGARCIGEELGYSRGEDLFLAGLLQDIGVLALDQAQPSFYAELSREASHGEQIAYEQARIQDDHAALGAWLLGTWGLPVDLCRAVKLSHHPEQAERTSQAGQFVHCVALGSELAAAFLAKDKRDAFMILCDRARHLVGLTQEQAGHVVERVTLLTPDLGQLFDTTLLSSEDAARLLENAHELLAARSFDLIQQVDLLKFTAHRLTAHSEELEDANRRDGLTGVYNRRHLDDMIAAEFSATTVAERDLAVLFIDLDRFKSVNDMLGHRVGDTVLRGTAELLKQGLRGADLLGRYGGEEFVILLPGASRKEAHRLGERLLGLLRGHPHQCDDTAVVVTASIGLAVQMRGDGFRDAAELISAADQAMRQAKKAGRNRLVEYHATPKATHAGVP